MYYRVSRVGSTSPHDSLAIPMHPTLELALVCTLLITTAAIVTRRSKLTIQVATLAIAVLLCVPIAHRWASNVRGKRVATRLAKYRPADLTRTAASPFAGSRACQACHPSEYATWAESYHRTMTQAVTPDSVLANFDDVTLSWQGRTYRAFKDGDRFMIDVPAVGTTGETPEDRVVRPVVMSTGSHHQQLYWYPLPEADEAPSPTAEALYAERCASCHGARGKGGEAPALTQRELISEEIEEALADSRHTPLVKPPLDENQRVLMGEFVERMQVVDKLMQFPFSWIVADQRWVHEDMTFLGPNYDETDVEPYDQGWSNSCDGCHAVGARFESPDAGRLGRASAVELGISCEVCHGPGQRHVLNHRNPVARYEAHQDDEQVRDDISTPTELSPSLSAAVCGQCHGETLDRPDGPTDPFRPGDRLEDHVYVVRRHDPPYPKWLEAALAGEEDLLDGAFWEDGTMRVAGRDYNALVETGCHTRGELTCITCHKMHGAEANDQLKPEAQTNEVGTRCHDSVARDVTGHTHHAADSPGSACYNCHMPHTTWGLLGAKRSHRVTSPNAAVSLSTGRPSACNLCHLDQPLAWTEQHLTAWYDQAPAPGPESPELSMPSDVSAALVWLIRGNGVQRAIAAWHFGWEPAKATTEAWWAPAMLSRALNDPYAGVRYVAHKSLRSYPGYADFTFDYAGNADVLYGERIRALSLWQPPSGQTAPLALMLERGPDLGRLQALEILRDTRPATINE